MLTAPKRSCGQLAVEPSAVGVGLWHLIFLCYFLLTDQPDQPSETDSPSGLGSFLFFMKITLTPGGSFFFLMKFWHLAYST